MRYIGSKRRLAKQIFDLISTVNDGAIVYGEPFLGTGAVAKEFARAGLYLELNDVLTFPTIMAKGAFRSKLPNEAALPETLNALPEAAKPCSFFYDNFSENSGRLFFTDENARIIDNCISRLTLEVSATTKVQRAALLDAISNYANNTGVFGAYLKQFRAESLRPITLKYTEPVETPSGRSIYNQDCFDFLKGKRFDILYCDPPYNGRDYVANYSPLECAALLLHRKPVPALRGKAGLLCIPKSDFCIKSTVESAFGRLVSSANTHIFALSYSQDGILQKDTISDIISSRFNVLSVAPLSSRRYNSGAGGRSVAASVKEWLFLAKEK